MHGHAELKCFANRRGFLAGANASPERRVEKDHIHRGVKHVGGELLEIDHDSIGRERYANHFASAAHAVQAVYGILQVIVTQALNCLAETNRLLRGPDAVGIETQ